MNVPGAVDWVAKNGPAVEAMLQRINNLEAVVLPLLGAAGAPIAAGITVAEDVVEGVTDLAAKVDAMFGPGTTAKLQDAPVGPVAPAKPAPAANGPTPAQIIAAKAAGK
jgi:hypothetical protein